MDYNQTQALHNHSSSEEEEDESDSNGKVIYYLDVPTNKHISASQFQLHAGENVIGRDTACDVCIKCQTLSKQHAVIEISNGSYVIYDLGSLNKTKKDKSILKPKVRYSLQNNDRICLADIECKFIVEEKKKAVDESEPDDTPSLLLSATTNASLEAKENEKDELAPSSDSNAYSETNSLMEAATQLQNNEIDNRCQSRQSVSSNPDSGPGDDEESNDSNSVNPETLGVNKTVQEMNQSNGSGDFAKEDLNELSDNSETENNHIPSAEETTDGNMNSLHEFTRRPTEIFEESVDSESGSASPQSESKKTNDEEMQSMVEGSNSGDAEDKEDVDEIQEESAQRYAISEGESEIEKEDDQENEHAVMNAEDQDESLVADGDKDEEREGVDKQNEIDGEHGGNKGAETDEDFKNNVLEMLRNPLAVSEENKNVDSDELLENVVTEKNEQENEEKENENNLVTPRRRSSRQRKTIVNDSASVSTRKSVAKEKAPTRRKRGIVNDAENAGNDEENDKKDSEDETNDNAASEEKDAEEQSGSPKRRKLSVEKSENEMNEANESEDGEKENLNDNSTSEVKPELLSKKLGKKRKSVEGNEGEGLAKVRRSMRKIEKKMETKNESEETEESEEKELKENEMVIGELKFKHAFDDEVAGAVRMQLEDKIIIELYDCTALENQELVAAELQKLRDKYQQMLYRKQRKHSASKRRFNVRPRHRRQNRNDNSEHTPNSASSPQENDSSIPSPPRKVSTPKRKPETPTQPTRFSSRKKTVTNQDTPISKQRNEQDRLSTRGKKLVPKLEKVQLTSSPSPKRSRKQSRPVKKTDYVESEEEMEESSVTEKPSARVKNRVSTESDSESEDVKVAFSGISKMTENYKMVHEIGGHVVDSVSECTHLIADKLRRTVKIMCAIARGIPVVRLDWLAKSSKAGKFLDPTKFLLSEKQIERQYKFNLAKSLEKAKKCPLLSGYKVHVTRQVKPEPQEMKLIIEHAGGEFLTRLPATTDDDKIIVISCKEDLGFCARAEKCNIPIVDMELLMTGILRQELKIKDHLLTR